MMILNKKKLGIVLKSGLIISLLVIVNLQAQVFSDKDTLICKSKFKFAADKNLVNEPIGDVIASIGKSFIGTEYAEHTLEKAGDEALVVNLSQLDCTTFLENTLALSRCIKEKKTTFKHFTHELTNIRYRNGIINKYPSRLHYFSDWIFDNEQKGIIKNISAELGGTFTKFHVYFMSTHPGLYIKLKEHPEFVPVIESQEKEIDKREYSFISKENVAAIEKKIQNGDLIAITSGIKGLDINHVGIAVKMDDGRIHLMHAPNIGSKVQITEAPLSDYLSRIKKDNGIIVIRAVEP